MKIKLFGILISMLLIVTVVPMSTTLAEKGAYKPVSIDRGWTWVSSYPNYAPSGMPDFDQRQDQWQGIIDGGNGIAESTARGDDVQVTAKGSVVDPNKPAVIAPGLNCTLESYPQGDDIRVWMFSSAVTTMNCFWWFDSRYDDPDGFPGDGEDEFPLVKDYGAGDDHAIENAPLAVEKMANALNITSTLYLENDVWIDTIDEWIVNVSLEDVLDLNFYTYPTFDFIAGEIETGRAVILLINFIKDNEDECKIVGSHAVTCAGVNSDDIKIAICDPYWDVYNPSEENHNDTQYVSHDRYKVELGSPCEDIPEIEWWLPTYETDYNYSVVHSALVINYINYAPETPTIDGPTSGNAGTAYNYTFNSVDPNIDDVYYYILWGDGYVENWDGPHASGEDFEIAHTYKREGTFTIEAKARDPSGYESGVATLDVTMPRNKAFNFNLLSWFLERFPMLERLLDLLNIVI